MHSTQYNKWTAEETRYIISAAREYKTSKIDWIAIQALVPHRTVQQCKSFYNNTVKEYDIYYLLKHHGLQAVAQKALYYLLTDNLNSCQDARKKAYFNNLQVDALINIFQVLAGNLSFKYMVQKPSLSIISDNIIQLQMLFDKIVLGQAIILYIDMLQHGDVRIIAILYFIRNSHSDLQVSTRFHGIFICYFLEN
ncbi:SANT/Myb_domain [Hexamita inflata]|uniref:SANT/Myb domain n=1 Tax=Hexamita inflata TaxID=28002 RepID=A0AA86P1R5_9EUKA|nr:SANT/Myb domain [Hexamita inflata]